MYEKEMAEDLATETQRANEWEAKYTELLAEYVQLLGEYGKIVRCKDCKYWDYEVDNDVGFCTRTEDCDWNADDFCSKGEKK